MMNKDEFREALISADSEEEILKIFCDEEEKLGTV
jgi:mannitol/fructose-specific phosphotransferase system IIA component (Ntr-type)